MEYCIKCGDVARNYLLKSFIFNSGMLSPLFGVPQVGLHYIIVTKCYSLISKTGLIFVHFRCKKLKLDGTFINKVQFGLYVAKITTIQKAVFVLILKLLYSKQKGKDIGTITCRFWIPRN